MRCPLRFAIVSLLLALLTTPTRLDAQERARSQPDPGTLYDIVIYGGTSAAITAAVQARQMGKTVVVISPDKHLGGLSSGGLGWTDTGNKAVIGGLSREFYHRVWKHYQTDDAWRWQTRGEYGNRGQGTAAIDGDQRTMWIFEPHVAEAVFDDWIAEHRIPLLRTARLNREDGVQKENGRIRSISTLDGQTFRGRMFIDATYEGDLMAAANVRYHVGRESNSQYGESWNGVQKGARHHGHYFANPVDPYVVPGDPSSGLLPRISDQPPGENGEGDHRIQAYCFRMCLTQHDPNRLPFPKPAGYDPQQYELILRVFDTGWRQTFRKFDPIPNAKTDTNNHGPFSTDNIGFNYDYPEASYERREQIIAEHRKYQQGLMYFLANDPRVPDDVREPMAKWGLAKDEFEDNGHWPHQIYVREARRMIGRYVMTELDCLGERDTPESVGMGSYSIDSHNVQRYVTAAGHVQNEGDIGVRPRQPYRISYGSLTPKQEECENLLVPVACSSTHSAFGSIRMEPVFMILGQSAATGACLALDLETAVQRVPYNQLRERLLEDGQVLEWSGPSVGGGGGGIDPKSLDGIVIDDRQAKLVGFQARSRSVGVFIGDSYRHDDNRDQGKQTATFEVRLPKSGKYEVRLAYPHHTNREKATPVEIHHADGVEQTTVNQQKRPTHGAFHSLGVFRFTQDGTAKVIISNRGAKGHVIVDAVQFLPR